MSYEPPGPSPAKLRLVEDELKATKESLEQVMIERDDLAVKIVQQMDYIAELEQSLAAANSALTEQATTLVRLGESEGVD